MIDPGRTAGRGGRRNGVCTRMDGVTTLKDSTVGGAGRGAAAPPERAPEVRGGTHPTSIADFLTDGSLPGLCAELSRLTGVPVELRDAQGRLIVPGASGGSWRVLEEDRG